MTNPPDQTRPEGQDRRLVAVGVGTAVALVMLALALVFTSSFGAKQVAVNAQDLHWTNAVLGAAAIERAADAQAVVFAVDFELGVASEDAADRAFQEARRNAGQTALLAAAPEVDVPGLDTLLSDFTSTSSELLSLLEAGDVEAAAQLQSGELEPAFQELTSVLTIQQDEIVQTIDDTEATAGWIGAITRIIVTLLIPGAALIMYRLLVKRQAERSRMRLEAKLVAEQELSKAKDEFIGSISHEIRTPLASIYGFSEILVESGLVDPEEAMELISIINVEAAGISRMVDDLLVAARMEGESLGFMIKDAPLRPLIETVQREMSRNGVDVTVDCGPMMVKVDDVRFRQVIRNLVSNAHLHGGPNIKVMARRRAGKAELVVSDDGPGVPEEIEERLFERFANEGERSLLVGSVGLGLAVAKSLVGAMDGELAYERVSGETRFIVSIPLAVDAGSGPFDRVEGREIAAFETDGFTSFDKSGPGLT